MTSFFHGDLSEKSDITRFSEFLEKKMITDFLVLQSTYFFNIVDKEAASVLQNDPFLQFAPADRLQASEHLASKGLAIYFA